MKRILYMALIALMGLDLSGCASDLNQDSPTQMTITRLYSTPDGLHRAVTALYRMHRNYLRDSNSAQAAVMLLDYSTDLQLYRGGTAAALARLNNFNTNNAEVGTWWRHYYQIIAKCNEIIYYAEQLGIGEDGDALSRQAWGEAKVFRARAYFELWQRFERIYINSTITTIESVKEEKVFRPSSTEDVFQVIKTDLDDAMTVLGWGPPGTGDKAEYGRMTKTIAKHIRAQVAMWEQDWETAYTQCGEIFAESGYSMMPTAIKAFEGYDLRNSEILWAIQFSENPGGANPGDGGAMVGHQLSLTTTPNYKAIAGLTYSATFGGYGWGRIYPNKYLLNKYDEGDKRRKELFHEVYTYNDPETLPTGAEIGDTVPIPAGKSSYITSLHLMSKKYFDSWTTASDPSRMSSFKDIPIYRLAQTYLMACEARFMEFGGSDALALEYYNKTWYREGNTGNSIEEGPLTIDMIRNEIARELHMEGVRWAMLKRHGILASQVMQYAGDSKIDDPNLEADYTDIRSNFVIGRHERWPIPANELERLIGYGQNDGWF